MKIDIFPTRNIHMLLWTERLLINLKGVTKMKKTNNVVKFVKNHKKEMLIATAASVVGVVGGIVGYKCHLSKDSLNLLKSTAQFKKDAVTGKTVSQSVKLLLDSSDSIHPAMPNETRLLADTVSAEVLSAFEEFGIKSTAKVSGIIVGIVND
jgi:hypothetical protein